MVEFITDLKNNKRKRSENQIQLETSKKVVTSVLKKRGISHREALGVSMDDIKQIETKGKWWLVGAAWQGQEQQDAQNDTQTLDALQDASLIKIAQHQKMNTDVRKSIFIILMSAEDCVDAYNRLLKLGLKEKQQRDIIRVLIHCCQRVLDSYLGANL